MPSERSQVMFISETKSRAPCRVNPGHIRKAVERLERAGWALVSREPADETGLAMEVMLIFQKGEAGPGGECIMSPPLTPAKRDGGGAEAEGYFRFAAFWAGVAAVSMAGVDREMGQRWHRQKPPRRKSGRLRGE